MPKIDPRNLDGVAFQFPDVAAAKLRNKSGGSSFLVGRPIKDSEKVFGRTFYVPYLVSNAHVVRDAPVTSINCKNGEDQEIWDFDPADWHYHPNGDDLAAICVMGRLDTNIHRAVHLSEDLFISHKVLEDYDIGIGDEVFMIGRFVNHQGSNINRPAVRFGSISMMLEKFTKKDGKTQEGFAVEMRSRTGFSGSPVIVYRTLATVLTNVPEGTEDFYGLFGVNFGYVFDENRENTWLNGVVPAWKISELFNMPKLMECQQQEEEKIRVENSGFTPTIASDKTAVVRDETLGRMLNTPPKPRT